MKLIIDNENIDFQLEQEKNLWDVLKSIEKYLSNYNRHIMKAIVNNNSDINIDDESSLTQFNIDKIKKLTIISETPLDNALNSLIDIKSYAEKVLYLIDEKPDKILSEKTEAITGLTWLVNGTMGAIYTIGINFHIIYLKTTFLKDFLTKATNITKKVDENKDNDKEFIKIFREEVKSLLEEFREFINVIGVRIYFNILYGQNLDKFKDKAKELFDINIASIETFKTNLDKVKNDVKSDDDSISVTAGQNFINLISVVINDIVFSSRVVEVVLKDININESNAEKLLNETREKLANMEVMLVKNKKKEEFAQKLDDDNFKEILNNISYVLSEMKKNMDK